MSETENTGNETERAPWEGEYAEYQLKGSNIPEAFAVEKTDENGKVVRVPRTFRTRQAKTDEQFLQLVKNGRDDMRKLAQSAWDIIVQRKLREAAESEDVAKMLADGDLDGAVDYVQSVADEFVYGQRVAGSGTSAVTKQKAKTADTILAAAAADPELAERLAALGIAIPGA